MALTNGEQHWVQIAIYCWYFKLNFYIVKFESKVTVGNAEYLKNISQKN